MYKKSRFTIVYESFPEEGKCLLFNTFSQAEVVVTDSITDILNQEKICEDIHNQEILKQLYEMGFIVLFDDNEYDDLKKLFNQIQTSTELLQVTILTNMRCNLACTYCFEDGLMSSEMMDMSTSKHIFQYFKNKIQQEKIDNVTFRFYGGEPLLNQDVITYLASSLNELSNELGFKLELKMVSNGTLLTPSVVDKLESLGVNRIQVTLAGSKQFHDKIRPYKTGKGSFDHILKNLEYAVTKLNIDINCTVSLSNEQGALELIDILSKQKWAENVSSLRISPVLNTHKDKLNCSPDTELVCSFDEKTMEHIGKIQKLAIDRGFRPGSFGEIFSMTCPIINKNGNFVIDTNGDFYECPGTVGIKEFKVGNIMDSKERSIYTEDMWMRCKDCSYLPICGGGCMYESYITLGNYKKVSCPKHILEKELEEYLKKSYLKNKKT